VIDLTTLTASAVALAAAGAARYLRRAAPVLLFVVACSASAVVAHDRAGAFAFLLFVEAGALSAWLAWRFPSAALTMLRAALVVLATATLAERVTTGARPRWIANPNAIGSLLLLLLPYARTRLEVVAGVGAVLATGSRGAMLALLVAFAALVLDSYRRDGVEIRAWHYVAVSVALVVLVAALVWLRPRTVVNRLVTWQAAARLWLQRPVLGWGPWASRSLIAGDHADSAVFTLLLETGALGLFAFVYSAVALTRAALDSPGNRARLAVLAWLVHQTVDWTLVFLLVVIALGVNVALLLSPPPEEPA